MKRFSLKCLFAFVTLLVVFVGYSQRRRRHVLADCAFLQTHNVAVVVRSEWQDYLWQRAPRRAVVKYPDSKIDSNGQTYDFVSDDNVKAALERLGIDEIRFGPGWGILADWDGELSDEEQSWIAE
jgi:hypothetical protein